MIVKDLERKENNSASFKVESDAAEFEAAVNSAYLKNRASIYIPGFRKGKAPRAVVEGMYGAEAFYQDAMDELAPAAFDFAVESEGLRIVGAPSIADVSVSEQKTVEYTFTVTLYPEATLGQYKGLKAERDAAVVEDAAVDAELESVQRRNARMVTVEDRPAKMGDTVNIDFDGYLEGERFDGGKAEGYNLELGSNSFVPGFEDQLVGMATGDEKDIPITFPQEYVEDLAGKDVIFKVKINSITYPEYPAIDDEFAKDVSEFDTLAEYKADTRANLEKKLAEQVENKVRSDIMRQACDNMTVDIPEVMIQEKIEEIVRNYAANFGLSDRNTPLDKLMEMMGLDEETIKTSIHPTAEAQVKSDILLEAISKAENIEISDEEAEEYAKKVAEDMKVTAEQIIQYFGMDFIKAEYKKEKAGALMFDSGVITDAKPAKKAAAKKTAKKADTATEEAPAEKKPAAKKATKKTEVKAEEAPAEKKPAAKKTAKKTEDKNEEAPAQKKPAAKKTTKKAEAEKAE